MSINMLFLTKMSSTYARNWYTQFRNINHWHQVPDAQMWSPLKLLIFLLWNELLKSDSLCTAPVQLWKLWALDNKQSACTRHNLFGTVSQTCESPTEVKYLHSNTNFKGLLIYDQFIIAYSVRTSDKDIHTSAAEWPRSQGVYTKLVRLTVTKAATVSRPSVSCEISRAEVSKLQNLACPCPVKRATDISHQTNRARYWTHHPTRKRDRVRNSYHTYYVHNILEWSRFDPKHYNWSHK